MIRIGDHEDYVGKTTYEKVDDSFLKNLEQLQLPNSENLKKGIEKLHENWKVMPKLFGDNHMTQYKWERLQPWTLDDVSEPA